MNSASTTQSTVRYATSPNLPAGHGVVVVQTPNGPVMVVRQGRITADLVEEIVEMWDALTACGVVEQPEKE